MAATADDAGQGQNISYVGFGTDRRWHCLTQTYLRAWHYEALDRRVKERDFPVILLLLDGKSCP
jgi:hypothetical protein